MTRPLMLHRHAAIVLGLAGLPWCGRAYAQSAPAPEPTQKEMLEELRSLRAEVKDLRSRLDAQQPTTQPSAATAPAEKPAGFLPNGGVPPSETDAVRGLERPTSLEQVEPLTGGWDPAKGFVLRSEDNNFLFHPWAFIQVRNATNYRQSGNTATTGGDSTQNGFELPRMKMVFDGNMFTTDFTYQFIWAVGDTSGAAPTGGFLFLQDAWARYHIPGTNIGLRAGNIRDPFDHEQILFGTRSLTPERSIVNNVMANGDGIVKGASIGYGYDGPSPFRTEIAITGGMRNTDTTFQTFTTNPATWGVAGRFEYKFFGEWKDYTQFTSLGDAQPLLVLGGGVDYTEAGRTADFSHVLDIQYDMPNGLALYAAYLGRYTRSDAGAPGTNGTSTTAGRFPDTYDSTLRIQAGYLLDQHIEPFGRYEFLHFDGVELTKGFSHDTIQDITAGFNYYFQGHRLKFTAAVSYLPDGSPITNLPSDLLSNRKNEVILQAQFQLMI